MILTQLPFKKVSSLSRFKKPKTQSVRTLCLSQQFQNVSPADKRSCDTMESCRTINESTSRGKCCCCLIKSIFTEWFINICRHTYNKNNDTGSEQSHHNVHLVSSWSGAFSHFSRSSTRVSSAVVLLKLFRFRRKLQNEGFELNGTLSCESRPVGGSFVFN